MITITIPDDLELKIIDGIMSNQPEASFGSGLRCTGWDYEKREFDFCDEDGVKYAIGPAH